MRSHSKVLAVAAAVAGVIAASAQPAAADPWQLTATSPGGTYAPTFTGNGLLGVRVPPAGQGYAPGTVPALSELAGFYAVPTGPVSPSLLQDITGSTKQPDPVQQRANLPTWSTLTFGQPNVTPQISDWHQTIDLQTGIITTAYTWTEGADSAALTYQVLTDRARANVGLVQLEVTPHWSGLGLVTDAIDGTPAYLSHEVSDGATPASRTQWVTIAADGTGIEATLASQLTPSPNVTPYTGPLLPLITDTLPAQSAEQHLFFTMTAGQTYTFTKYVGVVDSEQSADTVAAAESAATTAAQAGWTSLVGENDAAWAALWRARVAITGAPTLAAIVNASQFYLWSSTRAGLDWSISPAGLSSNGYNGHIFWDAETWMFPSLLALHPDLAAGIDAYRYDRLSAAEQHATATGYRGARFPWESALDGTEQIPPPVSTNSEGLYEQHITADIALAQWQYYLATGDRHWLATRGWPVIEQAASFWASRVIGSTNGQGGGRVSDHIEHVTGPDEENPDVNDEVYTNAAAKTTLHDALAAAAVLHRRPPARWIAVANRLVIPVNPRLNIHPEFNGYRGQLVKQADVTLLQYPWAVPMSAAQATADLDYYVPRSDPNGPSMTDAVSEIDTSALGTPGCSAAVFTERSFEPFIRDPFDQFSETRTGGAFTFMTGIGGFLQEFIYGYSGLRFTADSGAVTLDPMLNAQVPGIVLHNLSWHGRRFTVTIGPRRTTVTLTSGAPLPVDTPAARHLVRRGHPLTMTTRRPDLAPTTDAARCGRASATSTAPGAPALAAVDGSPATGWQPAAMPATLTVPLSPGVHTLTKITLLWGRMWPEPPKTPNVPPAPGPVITLRPQAYTVLVSTDGHTWRAIHARVRRRGSTDTITLDHVRAREVRLTVAGSVTPLLDELTATP